EWLTKRSLTGAELKDAEYGHTYTGGTALRRYVDEQSDRALAVYGVSAVAVEGEPGALVAGIHQDLRAGYPVIATIPSQWGTPHPAAALDAPSFSTHAVCFYEETAGALGLGAMNPWGGFTQTGDDGYWTARLCYHERWRIYRLSGGGSVGW